MKRVLVFLLILFAVSFSAVWAQTTIPIDPKATYLRTNEDPQALNASPISLDALGISPGDTITVSILGGFSYCEGCDESPVWLAGGIFSSSNLLLPPSNLNRVPAARPIRQGSSPPCESWNTYWGDLPTDVSEDFGFWSDESATVKVPPGAHWLFIAVVDSFYGDNADPYGDLAVQIQKALVAIPLNILWRVVPWETNRMTTSGADERDAFPNEGEMFYAAADWGERGTTPLYRYFNGFDHRDSTLTDVGGGYTMEGPLAFPWTSKSLPGLSPMVEGFNPQTGDYALMQPGEKLEGYSTEGLNVFGYKRFYNQTESLLALTKGGVTVESNRVFGGALWRWTWNGKQFLSNLYSLPGSVGLIASWSSDIPNYIIEGMDGCGYHAPVAAAFNEGTTQVTSAVPLADPFSYDPNNPCLHPVIWRDVVLGKRLTLDFNRMGPVAKYTTEISLPTPLLGAGFYHPITSVNPEFNKYWFYDALSAELQEVSIADACEDSREFTPDFGGIILSTQAADYAIGIYGASVSQGGSVSRFYLLRHVCDDGEYSRMDVIRDGDIPAGNSSYSVYMMTGTLEQVRQHMNRLHSIGAK